MINVSFIYTLVVMLGLSFLISPAAVAQDELDEPSPCFSPNPALGDSAYWANTALELYSQEKYEEAIKTVDACLNQWVSGAIASQQNANKQKLASPPLGKFTPSQKKAVQENYLLNDVSVAIWVKARSLEETDQIELAKKLYSNCIFLSHGRAWDPNGWFWSPSDDCVDRGRKLLEN